MLPEHRTAPIEHRYEILNRRPPKPDLDEQQKENINRALTQSKAYRHQVRVELYQPYELLQVIGVVEQFDSGTQTFKGVCLTEERNRFSGLQLAVIIRQSI